MSKKAMKKKETAHCSSRTPENSTIIEITIRTFDRIIEANEIVLLLFYTQWCSFSRDVTVMFEEAGKIISKRYPKRGKVLFGKINCDEEPRLAKSKEKFIIGSYPTIKLACKGKVAKYDYRGKRNVENFMKVIEECIKDHTFDIRTTESWK